MEKKVTVEIKSTVNAQVGLIYPNRNLRRTWTKKGALQRIDLEELQEAIYEPGIEYLFKTGILYIENMEHKIALGLEEPDAEQPSKIIVLSDVDKENLLKVKPIYELRGMIKKLSHEQLVELAHYAIETKNTDQERIKLIEEASHVEIFSAVASRMAEERRDAAEKEAKGKA